MRELQCFAYALVLVRVASFVMFLPLFGGRSLPGLVKVGVSVALASVWLTSLRFDATTVDLLTKNELHWLFFGLLVAKETILGAVLSFALTLLVEPVRIAGSYIGHEMGLALATVTDPTAQTQTNVVSEIFVSLGFLLILACDLHHAWFGVLHFSFLKLPIGAAGFGIPFGWMAQQADRTHEMGLMIAGPVGISLFLTIIFLIVLAKVSPQMNFFSVGLSLRLAVAFGALLLFFPDMLQVMGHALSETTGLLQLLSLTVYR